MIAAARGFDSAREIKITLITWPPFVSGLDEFQPHSVLMKKGYDFMARDAVHAESFKRFLDSRKERASGTMQVLLVLRHDK